MNIAGIKKLAQSYTNEKREDKYRYLLGMWIFDNSDELILNGEVVSEKARFMMKFSNYDIEPKPKSFIASKIKNGVELKESDFILIEMKRIRGFIKQIKESDEKELDETIEILKSYFKELKSKIAPIKLIDQVLPSHFKNYILDKSSIYFYSNFILNWYNQRRDELEKNKNLNNKFKLLDSYNFLFRNYFSKVIKIIEYSISYEYNSHEIMTFKIKQKELEEIATSLCKFSEVIKRNMLSGDYSEAIKIQEYCLLVTNEIKRYLEEKCKVNIQKTFLKKHFNSIIKEIENSIEFEKIKFLKQIEEVKITLNKNELWEQVDIIENKIREIVNLKLLEVSDNPFTEFFNEKVQTEVENKIISEMKKYPNLSSADFESLDKKLTLTTFGELTEKLIANKTWAYFEPIFKNKAELSKRITQLLPFRNKYAHNNEANSINLHDAKASIDWFNSVLGL